MEGSSLHHFFPTICFNIFNELLTNFRLFRTMFILCGWKQILVSPGAVLHSAWKRPFPCFLMFTSCTPCFCIILYPFELPLLFKVSCRPFWSCIATVVLSPLIKVTRNGRSSWLYCYLVCFLMVWSVVCRQYCEYWILGSTQTSLQQPLSAVVINGKWHLSILPSPAQKLPNHINA